MKNLGYQVSKNPVQNFKKIWCDVHKNLYLFPKKTNGKSLKNHGQIFLELFTNSF